LLKNVSFIYDGTSSRPRRNGYIVVSGNLIAEVGDGSPPAIEGAEEFDLGGCLVLPGLINIHHHFFQAITRALPAFQRSASAEWLTGHYPIWSLITADDLAVAVRNAVAELLLSGATTSVDHAFLLRGHSSEMTESEIKAASELGIRLHLVRGCLPTIGGVVEHNLVRIMGADLLPRLIDSEDRLFEQCFADVRRWHDGSYGSMLQLAVGPSNLPYAKPHLLAEFARIADETGCGLHAHYHPRQSERFECRKAVGMEPIDYLEKSGWLRQGTILAHCTELDDGESIRFAATGTAVAHCPRTVMRLGYKIPPISKMRSAGIRVGIGVDGAASNDGGAFVSDMRLALMLHRCREEPSSWLNADEIIIMSTSEAAHILVRKDIGTIEVGKCADIAAFDLGGVDLAGSLAEPLTGFVFAGVRPRARLTLVNGAIVVRDGKLTSADEQKLAEATNCSAERLLERARHRFPRLYAPAKQQAK
jgi:8-oxoguanine deaminase